jgi:DNA-binding protein H-NS
MATLAELLAQKADLERRIAEQQREERAAAINQVRELMSRYGLTLADIGARGAAAAAAPRAKAPVKYRDPATGQTWSGRGLQPNWLKAALAAGRTLDEFGV